MSDKRVPKSPAEYLIDQIEKKSASSKIIGSIR